MENTVITTEKDKTKTQQRSNIKDNKTTEQKKTQPLQQNKRKTQ